jgi:[acyl-carrier-protein] S-malonyltransferase
MMAKIGFLFPGQASQKVGMGKGFFENFSFAQEAFSQADEILGFKISHMCFEGPEEDLKLTANTQPALLIVSFIASSLLGIEPELAAGHSLGEYSALVAAGSLSFSDAVGLVHRRGQYMQEAVPVGVGAMAAILGADHATVEEGIQSVGDGVVEIANWNSRDQIVIAGHKEAVERAISLIDAPRAVKLPVSAPFHCRLMQSAAEKLAYDLDYVEFRDLKFPVVTNVDARVIHTGEQARDALKRQVSSGVLWYKSMGVFEAGKISASVELGSGNVLSGLMKRISRAWPDRPQILNVEDPDTLARAQEVLAL